MKRIFAVLAFVLSISPALAGALPAPAGQPILTISGLIDNTNAGQTAVLDRAMLDALPGRTTTTATPWYDGKVSFTGPLGSELLKLVGAHGTMVKVTAVDDYSSEIPLQDFLDSPVIFADMLNAKPMSLRDKGPLFIIYPFDIRPDFYNEAYFGKSVWQIKALEVH
jgi:hypothetical protein